VSTLNKRVFDLALGSLLAFAAVPVIGALAVGVALTLRTWPFFVQIRVGKGGRHFRFFKLRTLPRSAPRYGLKPVVSQIKLPAFVRFLRKAHLDELPQLLLVPLGRLSLVGPRPKMPDEFEPVCPQYSALRTQVPQGCTGLWQIGRHKALLPHETPEYDYFYLKHHSLRLDLWILWRTALTMLRIGRAVTPADVPRRLLKGGEVPAPILMPEFHVAAGPAEAPAALAS
jgi:lipopolysaccharide/colanic/teichoic acid biosynthesis glycosyltransferase